MINLLHKVVSFLEKPISFLLVILSCFAGLSALVIYQFDNTILNGFNLYISIFTWSIASLVLIAGARSQAALHLKLDELIRSSNARNDYIALDQKSDEEIDQKRIG